MISNFFFLLSAGLINLDQTDLGYRIKDVGIKDV